MTRHAAAVRAALVAAAALTLVSCGSGMQFVRQDMTRYPAKPADAQVEIHEGGTLTPHVVIGTFTAHRDMTVNYGEGSNSDRLMDDLRKAARKVGADALIEVHPVLTDDSADKARITVTATAIRYMQEASRVSGDTDSR
jgi:hypothetical protein